MEVLVLSLAAVAFGLGVWGLSVLARWEYQVVTKLPGVEERYGFEADYTYVQDPGSIAEVIQFSAVRADGPFARAGVREGDFLTPGTAKLTPLCLRLHDLEPGGSAELRVRTPEDEGDWTAWPERTVTVVAP